jgi:pimeloyl-ACP methyl ester carboxylesterase
MITTLEVGGVPVAVEVHGTGTPLLMIHGWGVDRRLMTGCLEPLFDDDAPWQRVYPDLPGMGGTPGDPSVDSSDAMVRVLLAVLDAVAGDGPFGVVGESYGGYLARGVLAARPDDILGLALICPVADPRTSTSDAEALEVVEPDAAFVATLNAADRDAFGFYAVREGRPFWERFAAEALPGIRAADQGYLEGVLGCQVPFAEDVDARPFDRPVLVVTGRQDSAVGYRAQWRLLERFPRSTYVVLDRAGHNAQLEQPELFGALVREWLERVTLARATTALSRA